MRKFLSVLFTLLIFVTCTFKTTYADTKDEISKIDEYVTQEKIESYFGEDNTLEWLNDLFYSMQITDVQQKSLEGIEYYIKGNFENIKPYTTTNTTVTYDKIFSDYVTGEPTRIGFINEREKTLEIPSLKLDLATLEEELKEDKLIMLITKYNNEPSFYVIHETDENNENALFVSTVGIFNIYKQKVNLDQLIQQCDSFSFYALTIPTFKTYPLSNWSEHYYTSNFGMRIHPINGLYLLHDGVDIGASMGTNVYAVQDGIVTVADTINDSDSGLWVEITHDDGYVTRYLHASEIYVKVGQRVKAGDVIMAVGATGAATGPHLHFSYLLDDEFLNPEEYLDTIMY